jgi:hypothetical protein
MSLHLLSAVLQLGYNQLSGSIPTQLGQLTKLTVLLYADCCRELPAKPSDGAEEQEAAPPLPETHPVSSTNTPTAASKDSTAPQPRERHTEESSNRGFSQAFGCRRLWILILEPGFFLLLVFFWAAAAGTGAIGQNRPLKSLFRERGGVGKRRSPCFPDGRAFDRRSLG